MACSVSVAVHDELRARNGLGQKLGGDPVPNVVGWCGSDMSPSIFRLNDPSWSKWRAAQIYKPGGNLKYETHHPGKR